MDDGTAGGPPEHDTTPPSAAHPAPAPATDRAQPAAAGDTQRAAAGPTPPPADARLDDSAWRVFGRRLPRRYSLYFRFVAGGLLVLFLVWWFTADVTYVSNVKVSGLEAADEAYREPLETIAADFAALVNQLADRGYAWQPGGLPALRAADALSDEEAREVVALGSLEVKKGNDSLVASGSAQELATFLREKGWTTAAEEGMLEGATKAVGTLQATVAIESAPEGRERLLIRVTPAP